MGVGTKKSDGVPWDPDGGQGGFLGLDDLPFPAILVDLAKLKNHVSGFEFKDGTAFEAHLVKRHDQVGKCMEKIELLSVNQACLAFFGTKRKIALFECLRGQMAKEIPLFFVSALGAVFENRVQFSATTHLFTCLHEKRRVLLTGKVLSGAHQGERAVVHIQEISESCGHDFKGTAEGHGRLFSRTFHGLPAAVSITRVDDGCFIEVNQAFERIFGHERNRIIGKKLLDLNIWVYRRRHQEFMALFEEHLVVTDFEARFLTRSGRMFTGLVSAENIEFNGVQCIVMVVFDVTRQKKKERINRALLDVTRAAQQSGSTKDLCSEIHKALEYSINMTNFFIGLYDREQDIITFPYYVDEQDGVGVIFNAEKSYSLCSEVIRKQITLLFTENELKERYDRMETRFPGTIPRIWLGSPMKVQGEVIGVVAVQSYVDPVMFNQDDAVLLEAVSSQIAASIEHQREEEEKTMLRAQLGQAQKMEALGTLAGGIAHDFNNIIAAIMGYTQLVQMESPDNPSLQKKLERIYKACLRAKDLVQQILGFSRHHESDMCPIRLGLIVKETFKFLRATLPSTITLKIHVNGVRDTIMANSSQIHQILMNLCTNAAHAMGDQPGILSVTLEETKIHQILRLTGGELLPGTYLLLSVRDTGHGMDKETMQRIFEPFFTTKSNGTGTGLGLSLVHTIVQNHEGGVDVESSVGLGACFKIFLPLFDEQLRQPTLPDQDHLLTGGENILVVDDEEAIVQSVSEFLRDMGYTVTAMESSPAALSEFRNSPQDFDLVITDMTMPFLTGFDLAREMIQVRPEIPIILCTGFGAEVSRGESVAVGIRKILHKPMDLVELVKEVRRVLDAGNI
ncbi:MAG: response regulator [Desulfobacterium sp.]|nr:response regulator [Desulfobacterium sp.]